MIISKTPLRMSFAGGGTDFSEYYTSQNVRSGAVVSTAINKYVYIIVNKKFDDLIRVSYWKTEMVEDLDSLEHNIIREALKLLDIRKGVEIYYMADIPLGSAGIGLGSSSGLAVGVLNALYAFKGQHVSAERLAQEAYRIEKDILGHTVGKQDQYMTAYGGFNFVQFAADGSVSVEPIICAKEVKRQLQERLLLFYTGIARVSSEILLEQEKSMPDNIQYFHTMVDMAKSLAESLSHNRLVRFGETLHEGWLCKKKLAGGISNNLIDTYYDRAIAAGATGGKLLGAGGGGFLVLYCEGETHDAVRQALSDLKECPFAFEPQGSKIIYVSD